MINQGILLAALGFFSFLDLKWRKIPRFLLMIGAASGAAVTLVFREITIRQMLSGIALGAGLLILAAATSEKIGKGDGYVYLMCGTYVGIRQGSWILVLSLLAASLFGAVLLVCRRKNVEIPLIPFVFAAQLLIMIGMANSS